ncbi:MAG: hypothetical protein R3204_03875, partial [Oceanospirillum sp.]|nr:hypothetical protein [Oceanospirillum sp.]
AALAGTGRRYAVLFPAGSPGALRPKPVKDKPIKNKPAQPNEFNDMQRGDQANRTTLNDLKQS